MRCKYCGSEALHSADQQKGFSAGKAVAGTVVFGPVGAVAGLTGKTIHGFRCGACGAFMEAPMDTSTESMVNDAIYLAKQGQPSSMYGYYKKQYPNIENVALPEENALSSRSIRTAEVSRTAAVVKDLTDNISEKSSNTYGLWLPDGPVYYEQVIIRNNGLEDLLSLNAINQTNKVIRSLYLQVSAYDDTGDLLTVTRCVYQGVNVEPGKRFPEEYYALGTNLAYRVELFCEKAAFEDGDVWRAGEQEDAVELKTPVIIDENSFPRYNYLCKEYRKSFVPKYIPEKHDLYWCCTCGMPVKPGEKCPQCKYSYEELEKLFSQEYLRSLQQEAVFDRAAKRSDAITKARNTVINKHNEADYKKALASKAKGTSKDLKEAEKIFVSLGTYKDASVLAEECNKTIPEIEEAERKQKEFEEQQAQAQREKEVKAAKKRKRLGIFIAAAVAVCIAAVLIVTQVVLPNNRYNNAVVLMEGGEYEAAIQAFEEMNGYKDSADKIKESEGKIIEQQNRSAYDKAMSLLDAGNYLEAKNAFVIIKDYSDSEQKIAECSELLANEQYEKAIQLMLAGSYQEAIDEFELLDGYSDSDEQISNCKELLSQQKYEEVEKLVENHEYKEAYLLLSDEIKDNPASADLLKTIEAAEPLFLLDAGDTFTFGTYEQDNDSENGTEDIEWIVIGKDMSQNRVLAVSKYILDCQPYNKERKEVTWANSTIRTWLNFVFYRKAFSDLEKDKLLAINVHTEKNPYYNTDGGSDTIDRVFLLSISEAKRYFISGDYYDENEMAKLKCLATPFAISQGVEATDDGYGPWGLRTPGAKLFSISFVARNSGAICGTGETTVAEEGAYVDASGMGVRPVISIDGNYSTNGG